MHGMVLGGCIFVVVGTVAKLRGGVMSVSSSNTNPMRMYPPVICCIIATLNIRVAHEWWYV